MKLAFAKLFLTRTWRRIGSAFPSEVVLLFRISFRHQRNSSKPRNRKASDRDWLLAELELRDLKTIGSRLD
ncbi:hypothetical protein NUW54_g9852 [Trametes sanguinea]|uniref:Uncharacterized protein n=1 Tax=Trametes sanguinea TaxID=158606 RepID=A0ACC1P649_9APHY|nr:hypothetical protein NUW54_g9852 [Trametes sanguinea]